MTMKVLQSLEKNTVAVIISDLQKMRLLCWMLCPDRAILARKVHVVLMEMMENRYVKRFND